MAFPTTGFIERSFSYRDHPYREAISRIGFPERFQQIIFSYQMQEVILGTQNTAQLADLRLLTTKVLGWQ